MIMYGNFKGLNSFVLDYEFTSYKLLKYYSSFLNKKKNGTEMGKCLRNILYCVERKESSNIQIICVCQYVRNWEMVDYDVLYLIGSLNGQLEQQVASADCCKSKDRD
jgi:hypothetical protein